MPVAVFSCTQRTNDANSQSRLSLVAHNESDEDICHLKIIRLATSLANIARTRHSERERGERGRETERRSRLVKSREVVSARLADNKLVFCVKETARPVRAAHECRSAAVSLRRVPPPLVLGP